jgi:oxygen-independent coproporphyrinogen-3 oxidase
MTQPIPLSPHPALKPAINHSWLAQLDARVPRYTSYPTAPHFHTGITGEVFDGWLQSLDPAKPVSLYVHVPFCAKLCWYCGCNAEIVKSEAPVSDYLDLLMGEIARTAALLPKRMKVSHLHFGGGSPNMLSLADFHRVMDGIESQFDFLPDAERAIELDPRGLDAERIEAYAWRGIGRASIGVQDLDPDVQKAIHRIQPLATVKRAVDRLRDNGIEAINFDLLYGLPLQSVATIEKTVEEVLALDPARIALFGYAHVPWMKKYQKALERYTLPGQSERAMLAQAARVALEARYQPVGIDHFARPDDSMAVAARNGTLRRNFQGYTTDRAETLIGFGPSAISETPQGYAQNEPDLAAWSKTRQAGRSTVHRGIALTDDDRLRRAVIERLMCDLFVDLDAMAERFNVHPVVFLPALERLEPYEEDGMVTVDGWEIRVPEEARIAVRSIAAAFDTWLKNDGARHAAAV